MTARRWIGAVGMAVLLAAVLAGATPLQVGADHADDARGSDGGAAAPSGLSTSGLSVAPDSVLLSVHVAPNGTAYWTVEYRVRLDDPNTTAAFADVQSEVRENPRSFEREFAAGMRQSAAAGERATGREMYVENVTVTAVNRSLPQPHGTLVYRFRWIGFAAVHGDGAITAGPVLEDLYLEDEETTLLVSWPEEYEVESVAPSPDETRDTAVEWTGPQEFASGRPSVQLVPRSGRLAAPDGGLLPLALVGMALAVIVGGGGWVLSTRRSGDDGAGGAEDAVGGTGGVEGPTPPETLLSDEERVVALLEDRGGRMKQQEVVDETGWSETKTSKVVREMREDGRIDAFRLGRENVLALPEEDLAAVPDSRTDGESAGDEADGPRQ